MSHQHLPVAIIGGGPVGLAAAAHLLAKGEDPIVFEAGASAGAAMRFWGHVRLFSPWRYVIDEAARDLLAGTGWVAPDPEIYPTGNDVAAAYLQPLSETPALRSRIRLGHRVTGVTRAGFDKMK